MTPERSRCHASTSKKVRVCPLAGSNAGPPNRAIARWGRDLLMVWNDPFGRRAPGEDPDR